MTREQILKKPDIRREWIKFQMGVHGTSLAELARELGVTRQTVCSVFARPYPKVERAIAEAIGMRPEDIWPERYGN